MCHIPRSYRNAKPNHVSFFIILDVQCVLLLTLLPEVHGDFGSPNGTNGRINRKLEPGDDPTEILSPQLVSTHSIAPYPSLTLPFFVKKIVFV